MDADDRRIDSFRPALSPIFIYAIVFWASCAASYSIARLQADLCIYAVITSGVILVILIAFSLHLPIRHQLLIAASLSTGLMLGFAQGYFQHQTCQAVEAASSDGVTITLAQDSSNKGNGEKALARIELEPGHSVLAMVRFPDEVPRLYGERYQCTIRFSAADYTQDQYAWNIGSCGTAWVDDLENIAQSGIFGFLVSTRASAISGIGNEDDAHCILQALACGYRHDIAESQMYQSYQACGLAHLVAVSGAHLVIVTSLIASLLQAMRVPRKASIIIMVALMASYLVLSGCPISALRAAAMSSIGVFSLFAKRRPSSINALGIGVFVLIACNPANAVSVSFSLSTLSTMGIVCLAPLVQSWLDSTLIRRIPFAADALALTISSSALSQLYASSIFMTLPLISPLANMMTAPLFPVTCGLALVSGIAGALNLPAADLVTNLAACCSTALDTIIAFLSRIPYSSIPFWMPTILAIVLSASLAMLLWAIWPHAKTTMPIMCGIAAILAIFVALPTGQDELVMFDVGQGDSILIRSNGHAVLVDTGNQDRMLKQELARNHIAHLDAVVITHADDDHCGSLPVLRDLVQVDRIMLAKGMRGSASEKARKLEASAQETTESVLEVSAGDRFRIGDFTATVVWPREMKDDGGNADSICLRLSYDGDGDGQEDLSAFFTGDAEIDQLEEIIRAGAIGSVDVLKVGHHGSRNAMLADQLRVLNPRVALIGVGKKNRYGHPTQEILSMLDEISCHTYRTDLDSQITCAFSADSLSVSTGAHDLLVES